MLLNYPKGTNRYCALKLKPKGFFLFIASLVVLLLALILRDRLFFFFLDCSLGLFSFTLKTMPTLIDLDGNKVCINLLHYASLYKSFHFLKNYFTYLFLIFSRTKNINIKRAKLEANLSIA